MTDTIQPLRRQLTVASETPAKTDGEIRWAPVHFSRRLSFAGTHYVAVREALRATFGEFPITLSYNPDKDDYLHATILKGMAAAAGEGSEPYEDLRTALVKYHGILITER